MATDQLRLARVQPRVLRQEVLDALRSAILNNRMRPGSRLLEAEVASRMGVSRAPVREAIRQLEQEGLVEFFPHRGAVVIGLPEDEIDAIYELRALIEGTIVELLGFTLLKHIWQSLDGLVRLRSYQALDRPGRAASYFLSGSIASHSILVDAIRAREPEQAEAAVRAHILDVARQLHAGESPPA